MGLTPRLDPSPFSLPPPWVTEAPDASMSDSMSGMLLDRFCASGN